MFRLGEGRFVSECERVEDGAYDCMWWTGTYQRGL